MGKFEDLYSKHVQSVFRYAFSCAGSRDLAEDLTSEAFLELYRRIDRIDELQLPGWLLTVVRNRARDLWRHRAVERRFAEQLARRPASEAPPLETWILQCADLKPAHRTCLALRYVWGLNRTEIADRTGLTELQVKSCLQYGLELLRKAYGIQAKEAHRDPAA